PPTPRTTASWVRRVQRPFRFSFKLHQRFTHERAEPPAKAEVEQFTAGLLPVHEAGLLGCLLLQFPWSFRCTRSALEWLQRVADAFAQFPLVLEVRHRSWDRPELRQQLAQMRINYCNIDQPQLNQCIGPSAYVTGPIGYVRLHGRRYDTWFAQNVQTHQRYDYLYSSEELTEWLERIRQLASQTEAVYVFANNHYRGQGPANALQLRSMLQQKPVQVPPELLRHFRFLRDLAEPPQSQQTRQGKLFE
ncbi:MAG: DUF72 domain-containing protein, partial [Phycisphaerae bacterium]